MSSHPDLKLTCNYCGKTGYLTKYSMMRHQRRSKICKGTRKLKRRESEVDQTRFLQEEFNRLGVCLVAPKKS